MSASVSVTPRRLTAAAAVAAALVGAVALPASAADRASAYPDRAQVVIGDVQSSLHGRYERSNLALNREWVDITNNGRHGVNLSGWTLSDRDGNTYTFRNYWLGGRSTVRVHTGVGRDSSTDVFQDRRFSVWDRDADTATLRNDHGRFIDAESWGSRRDDHRGYRDDDRHFRGEGDRHYRGDDPSHRGDHRF
ncbi:lamin tail domain-containing protein [Streptomyces sp. BK340]|uniref:lamin tail domain-containing protein n=1 Tax=Streptomyces sp. BK340 TaxID=2572903 RepID=UPI00119DA385|nr:lamin tail domain-containing protein [Streptomyces sp. BK340]TVZ83145.1 lamin tail-like protein [Streptomyces sp. BK340]